VDTTVWTAGGKSGVNDLELRAACEGKKESRAFLSFPRGGLPTPIEVRGVSLALCVTSKIGDAPVQLWAGSFPMPPTPGDFDTGWLSPPLAPLVQIPTANTALAIAGPSSWLGQASDIHLGLRVGGCPGANGGAVFVGSKSPTASPTCRAPLLAVRFCRADPSVSGYCNSAVDCSLTPELSCAVARCPNHRCEYEPVAAGSTCRASTGPCDVEEVCDGLKPTCPDDVPIVISSLTVSAKVAIVTKSGGVPSIKLGFFEAACVPGGQVSRGLLHFLTPGLINKKIYSASLAACHIEGIATAELHAIGLSLPFDKAHFSLASQGLAATLSQKTLGLETVALDPALVKAAPANAYRLELPATGPCLMWSGRRYGQSSSDGCSGWPVLTVKYCAGP